MTGRERDLPNTSGVKEGQPIHPLTISLRAAVDSAKRQKEPEERESPLSVVAHEIITEGTILQEMRNLYVEQFLAPHVAVSIQPGEMDSDKDDSLQAVREYLSERTHEQKKRLQEYDDSLFIFTHSRSFDVESDKEIILDAVYLFAQSEGVFEEPYTDYHGFESDIMPWWKALVASPTARKVFGPFLQEEDERIYQQALNTSLQDVINPSQAFDPHPIQSLYFYPTPDAIRNLVILSSFDLDDEKLAQQKLEFEGRTDIYNQRQQTVATVVLENLTQKKDWDSLKEQAVERYPELQTVLPARKTEFITQEVREDIDTFLLSLVNQEHEKGAGMDKLLLGALYTALTTADLERCFSQALSQKLDQHFTPDEKRAFARILFQKCSHSANAAIRHFYQEFYSSKPFFTLEEDW